MWVQTSTIVSVKWTGAQEKGQNCADDWGVGQGRNCGSFSK